MIDEQLDVIVRTGLAALDDPDVQVLGLHKDDARVLLHAARVGGHVMPELVRAASIRRK